ncbi:uncharacterized protein LOC127245085 [Andrographis paniculata]|uniref:uncharacterized protein LOC127245085 n=1 Tax=Andrographis paniculata TaxID=175694 RepID=UPI0021E8DBC5|nr:uncharacterized protein LOC127245085 [Andrographis paniculata]
MDSFSNNGDDYDDFESKYFDAEEHIVQQQESDAVFDSSVIRNWGYDVWITAPQSVSERRRDFIRWMGGNSVDAFDGISSTSSNFDDFQTGDMDRVMENRGRISSCNEVECSSTCNKDELHLSPGLDSYEQRDVDKNFDDINGSGTITGCKLRNSWLSRLRSMTCMMSWNVEDENDGYNQDQRIQRVKVHHYRRKLKEFSALFTGQDIQAHEGVITAMKFSHDGQYLASAGEDKTVKVWQVVEDERLDTVDIPDADPSCVYFSLNHLLELRPIMVEKEKAKNPDSVRGRQDPACIVLPSKIFRILEKPLHVFRGHTGEILDLSWSTNNCLLSSSVDKTVRLWQVGVEKCIKVFPHGDYVTCIQFNPVDNDYFVSGSIDGKIRIWQISGCRVVDWNETRGIITAVAYRPDGQGGIIGSIGGLCCYFDLSDNHLQLGTQMCLSTKKSPCKRITSFQFLPRDPRKVLVTCADSNVRIIDEMNVTTKYKGVRGAGNFTSASFTVDGMHIVSASDDSNVCIWNYSDPEESSISQPNTIRSLECFSADASVAIPWPGLKSSNSSSSAITSPALFSLSQEYFCDSTSKVSATWPEEKLPDKATTAAAAAAKSPISKPQYKRLKNCCQSSSKSHTWGMVILTAGWDGRIRSFQNYGLPVCL